MYISLYTGLCLPLNFLCLVWLSRGLQSWQTHIASHRMAFHTQSLLTSIIVKIVQASNKSSIKFISRKGARRQTDYSLVILYTIALAWLSEGFQKYLFSRKLPGRLCWMTILEIIFQHVKMTITSHHLAPVQLKMNGWNQFPGSKGLRFQWPLVTGLPQCLILHRK